jgi:hypothetical protein
MKRLALTDHTNPAGVLSYQFSKVFGGIER